MKSAVSITRERHIPASPSEVWAVIADPTMQERVDPRCRLVSASSDWREPGSEFVLQARGVRLRYVVTEASAGSRWVAEVGRGGRPLAVQSGELRGDGPGTQLTWTVTVRGGALTRYLARRSSARQLPRWLAAVERETLNHVRQGADQSIN